MSKTSGFDPELTQALHELESLRDERDRLRTALCSVQTDLHDMQLELVVFGPTHALTVKALNTARQALAIQSLPTEE